MEPDCETRARRPADSDSASSAALTLHAMRELRLTTPMEFGPRRRSPAACAVATKRAWSAAPSGPASAKPSASTQAAGMPFAATAWTTPSTCRVFSRM
jgi:hypothetical protein